MAYQIWLILTLLFLLSVLILYIIECTKNKELQDDLRIRLDYNNVLQARLYFYRSIIGLKMDEQLNPHDERAYELKKAWLLLNDSDFVNSHIAMNNGKTIKLKDIK